MSFFPPFLIPLQLAEKLENSEWTSQFLAQEGAISLMECILFCIFKMKYVSYFLYACFKKIFFFSYYSRVAYLQSSITGSDPDDVPRLEKLLTCITQMVNSGVRFSSLSFGFSDG
jgi:hypothetical protein